MLDELVIFMAAKKPFDWAELLKKYFQVPGEHVYILGCFARHVTLYSQQVRALNLIAALHETKALTKGTTVGIVGGGAAGLMAAAAAAHLGAKVTLIDHLSRPMGMQRNSRQRYLHPHIYDWPDQEWIRDEAKLPFFPWKADYAAEIALQFDRSWEALQNRYPAAIKSCWGVKDPGKVDPIVKTNFRLQ